MKYDLIIIGSGPAGLTAAIYAARYKMKVLVIGKIVECMASKAYEVWNYPGFNKISGCELMVKMVNQVKELGVEIISEDVENLEKKEIFEVTTKKEKYFAKKIIIATGSKKRNLGVEKEKEFVGKGISYCATCDAAFYKEKTVAVVGGGNSALTSALLLTKFAKKVYVIHRTTNFCRAEKSWIEEVEKNEKIEVIYNANITKIIGETRLEGVELDNGKSLELNGLFIHIGNIPNAKLVEKMGVKFECEDISVDKNKKTNVKGLFAAGDVTNTPLKQIVTACSDGAIAADSAYNEIQEEENSLK